MRVFPLHFAIYCLETNNLKLNTKEIKKMRKRKKLYEMGLEDPIQRVHVNRTFSLINPSAYSKLTLIEEELFGGGGRRVWSCLQVLGCDGGGGHILPLTAQTLVALPI
jgi:hypothetical protein